MYFFLTNMSYTSLPLTFSDILRPWKYFSLKKKPVKILKQLNTKLSHFWDRPVPIFSDVRFFFNLALVQDKKNHVRFTDKCMLYSLCQLPSQFSMLFLFKINNSLYISFQSFINTQILTISHIILFQSMSVYFE